LRRIRAGIGRGAENRRPANARATKQDSGHYRCCGRAELRCRRKTDDALARLAVLAESGGGSGSEGDLQRSCSSPRQDSGRAVSMWLLRTALRRPFTVCGRHGRALCSILASRECRRHIPPIQLPGVYVALSLRRHVSRADGGDSSSTTTDHSVHHRMSPESKAFRMLVW